MTESIEWQFGGWLGNLPPAAAWALLAGFAVVGTALVVWSYRRTLRGLSPAVRAGLTFLRLAVKEAGLPDLGELQGQTAIVVGDKDVAAAAKILKNFHAEFKMPVVKTGVVDRLVVSKEQIASIADLPSREVLLATLLGVLQAPAQQLVRLLNEPASALARVLKAKAEKENPAA